MERDDEIEEPFLSEENKKEENSEKNSDSFSVCFKWKS
jgi:hypothetical protein